jgi:hypothetical protein
MLDSARPIARLLFKAGGAVITPRAHRPFWLARDAPRRGVIEGAYGGAG